MAKRHQPNYFIFTGGPGAGKTSVLDRLKQRGYSVVSEVARAIIKEQNANGGNATHHGNRKVYCELMLQDSIKDYLQSISITNPIFFDRGIPDLYSYSNRFCGGVTTEINQAVSQYRYNSQVFIFPPWPEIYCHDTERKQTFEEAIDTYHAVKEGYANCGYTVLEMPKDSIEQRVDFILQAVEQLV